MKIVVRLATALLVSLSPAWADAQTGGQCADADPSSVLAAITGDFELSNDPQDPNQHILFLSNVTGGGSLAPQNVVVARMDAQSGLAIAGSLTTIANNFQGNSNENGPAWMETPQGQLGILYTGVGGVHAAYRASQPTTWNQFRYNYDQSATLGSPTVLPNTSSGAYPGNPVNPPSTAATYPQYMGACTSLCYAAYNSGIATDVSATLAPNGYTALTSTQANVDGWLYISACKTTGACGLYQGKINGAGGLTNFQQIAPTGTIGVARLAASQHPLTGAEVLFTNGAGNSVNVWMQAINGGPLTLIATVPAAPGADHFRANNSATQVVLNYFVRSGTYVGSYTVPVGASGTALLVGSSKMISVHASGTEFQWFPAADQWAIYYRTTTTPYVRCWVTP
jgi:hypothetical protein